MLFYILFFLVLFITYFAEKPMNNAKKARYIVKHDQTTYVFSDKDKDKALICARRLKTKVIDKYTKKEIINSPDYIIPKAA